MKKNLIYALALATTMVACTDDYTDWAAPQANGPEEAKSVSLSVSPASAIDFSTEVPEKVTIFSASVTAEEGAKVTGYKVTLTPAEGEGAIAIAHDNGVVASEDVKNAVISFYGKAPTPRTLKAVVDAYVDIQGQTIKVTAPVDVKVTLDAPFISTGYYLIGNMNDWNADKMFPFKHSETNVYDDPIFTLFFTTEADDQYWKIIPQSNVDNDNVWAEGPEGVLGVAVDGDTSMEGLLVSNAPQAGKIEKAGMYKMTLNMMDYTYTISALAPEYFILGDEPFGWDVNTKKFMLYPQSTTTHSYTTFFKGNIKMINSNDMGTDNWGACYGTSVDGDTSASADLKQNAGAIHVPEEGYYTLTVDFKESKYTWTKCENQAPTEYTNISLIGDFNSWGGDADLEQIAPHNWFIANFKVENTGGLKFRADHDWPTNWGATLNVADVNYGVGVGNGDNISVPAGTYNVFFNDITGEFVFQSI